MDDFGAAPRRERVVRLDPLLAHHHPNLASHPHESSSADSRTPGIGVGAGAAGLPSALGLEDLDLALRDSVRLSFQARQTAYVDEVRCINVCMMIKMMPGVCNLLVMLSFFQLILA